MDFHGFDKYMDIQTINYKNSCQLAFNSLLTLSGYSNKTIVDLQLQSDSLWCYAYEDLHSNKISSGFSADKATAMPFRSFIDRYSIKKGIFKKENTEKCLKDSVWNLDDQLLLEKIEDKENIHSAVMTKEVLANRFLRRFGGDYIKKIELENTSHSTEFIKRLKEIKEGNLENIDKLRKEYYEAEHQNLKPVSLSIISLGEHDSVPILVRTNSISVLKRNTKFTAYSKYINKNVVDIQLAYERNPVK